jgi:hypothetical protein
LNNPIQGGNDSQLPLLRSPGRPGGDVKGSVRTFKDDRGETAKYLLARSSVMRPVGDVKADGISFTQPTQGGEVMMAG